MFGAILFLLMAFIVVVWLPCLGVAILGVRLMERMGRYPSKTPVFQMNTFLKLAVLEIIAFGLLATLYHLLADYGKSG